MPERYAFEIDKGVRINYEIPGELITVDQRMPGFSGVEEQLVIGSDNTEYSPTHRLPRGPKLWNLAPSLDTPVCNALAGRFSSMLRKGELHKGMILVTTTMDLPFALDRVKREDELSVEVDDKECHYLLSDARSGLFVASLGALMLPHRLAERVAIVTVPDSEEPDYDVVWNVQEIVDQGIMPDYTPTFEAIRRIPPELFIAA